MDGRYLPPKFLHTVEADHAFYVLHPTLCCCCTWSLKDGSLRERGDGCLREVAALCRGGIEPERPGGIERVLISRRISAGGAQRKRERYLDVEIGRITEDGADALCLCMHIYFLDFARLRVRVECISEWVLCKGRCEGGLVGLLGWSGEGGRGHVGEFLQNYWEY